MIGRNTAEDQPGQIVRAGTLGHLIPEISWFSPILLARMVQKNESVQQCISDKLIQHCSLLKIYENRLLTSSVPE